MAEPPSDNSPASPARLPPTNPLPAGLLPALEEPAPGGGFNVVRVRAALLRSRWLILAIIAIGSAGSVLATRFLRPMYGVSARIMIQPQQTGSQAPIQAQEIFSEQNWVQLLRSYAVLDPVVLEQRLFLQPGRGTDPRLFEGFGLAADHTTGTYELEMDPAGASLTLRRTEGGATLSATPGDSIGREVGFQWAPPASLLGRGRVVHFTVVTPREASTTLASQLTTQLITQSSFLQISLTGPDGRRAATTVNALTHRFVTVAERLQREKVSKLRATLQEQVTQAESGLKAAEQALEAYRVRTITLPTEEQVIPFSPGLQATQSQALGAFHQQKQELDQIRRDRRAIEDVLRKTATGELAVDAFQTIPSVQKAPDLTRVLQELSETEARRRDSLRRWTPEHPGVRQFDDRVTTLRTTVIPAYAGALVSRLRSIESDLEARVAAASEELQSIPLRTTTEQRLRREVDGKRTLFTTLQSRYEEVKLAELSTISSLSILDTAVAPARPTRNTAPRIIFLGMMASITAAVGLALLLDRLDRHFRYPEQASDEMGLTILGAIPEIRSPRNGRPVHVETAQVIEAFRSIRLNLAHSYASEPILLTVSSPGSGDGKSLVVTNLALSFAEAGYNTLLIDGDTRRGELHRIFSAERRPGLLDCVSGHAHLVQILRTTSHRQLTLIPAGSRRASGPELLGSTRMTELLREVRQRYQVILLDSPPLGAGIDPFVLGTLTGNLLLVLRAGETDREMAESRLRIIDRLPIRMLGAVLNDFRSAGGAYKYYSYLSGYAAEEEEWLEESPSQSTLPEGPATVGTRPKHP